MENFMDIFTPYEKDFEEALENLKKVLTRCEQTQLSLLLAGSSLALEGFP